MPLGSIGAYGGMPVATMANVNGVPQLVAVMPQYMLGGLQGGNMANMMMAAQMGLAGGGMANTQGMGAMGGSTRQWLEPTAHSLHLSPPPSYCLLLLLT